MSTQARAKETDLGDLPRAVTPREASLHFARGVLMGAADIVPGVSGGTVALIVGIYGRLVLAISHVDRHWIRMLAARKWRAAAAHIDLAFLATLIPGIICGMALMTWWMHYLMTHPVARGYTLSVFFGVIFASSLIVASLIHVRDAAHGLRIGLLGTLGFAAALSVTWLRQGHMEPTLPYLFLCGVIAISAMILPGISGAMVLLLMGVYVYLTEIPHRVLHGDDVWGCLITVAVFGCGCLIGLLSFSKLLRFLLLRHHAETMAVLCGLMLGSLRNIWPYQIDLTPDQADFKLKEFELYFPTAWDGTATGIALVGIAAAAVVFLADQLARRFKSRHAHRKRESVLSRASE